MIRIGHRHSGHRAPGRPDADLAEARRPDVHQGRAGVLPEPAASPPQHFAARAAAKEATFKALGEGWPLVRWTDVEVVSGENRGRPSLVLTGHAAELAGEATPLVSLAHDAGVAIAEVLLVD